MADYLIGKSPPTKGPLKDIDRGGLELINAWINGMYEADLDKINDLVSRVEETLLRPLWKIQDALFDIKVRSLGLDKALWPYEDQLKRIEALVFRTTLPWVRQRRETQRQLELLRDIVDQQRKQAQVHLKYLERQIELMKRVVAQDRERLEFINHEILMEDLRNRILKRAGSARLLELESEKRVASDQLANDSKRLKELQDQLSTEQERLNTLKTIAELQIQVLEKQEQLLTRLISAEEDRVIYQREELKLAQALQIEERLRLTVQKRAQDEQLLWAQHYNATISRANKLLRVLKKTLDDTGESWDDLFSDTRAGLADLVDDIKSKLFPPLDRAEIEEAKRLLAEPWKDIPGQIERLKEAAEGLKGSWADMGMAIDVHVFPRITGFFNSIHLLDDYIRDTMTIWGNKYFKQPWVKAIGHVKLFLKNMKIAFQEVVADIDQMLIGWIARVWGVIPDWAKDIIGLVYPSGASGPRQPTQFPMQMQGAAGSSSEARTTAQVEALVKGFAGIRATQVVNNYTTSAGPTVNLEAHYANVQSPATVVNDIELMFQLVGA